MATLLALLLLALSGCTTVATSLKYGVQEGHSGYVPARIAMLPCTDWPAGARFSSLPLTNVKDAEVASLCKALDAFVLASFTDQPYMKGFSPKYVMQELDEAADEDLPGQIPAVWQHRGDDCHDCETVPAFYTASLAKRFEWLQWLNKFSKDIRNADALLLPFVTFVDEKRYNDRGLAVAERSAGVALLLIDTNNGELLWAGGREASVPQKQLAANNIPQQLAPPPWSEVKDRLLVDALLRDFPGRQVF